MALVLPDWLDPVLLQWLLLVVIAVVLYSMFAVARFVRRALVKLVLFVALAALGVSLWVQRVELGECARTCSCRLYGQEVQIPIEQVPVELRERDGQGTVTCTPAAAHGAAPA